MVSCLLSQYTEIISQQNNSYHTCNLKKLQKPSYLFLICVICLNKASLEMHPPKGLCTFNCAITQFLLSANYAGVYAGVLVLFVRSQEIREYC